MISSAIGPLLLLAVFTPLATPQQLTSKLSPPCTLTAEDFAVYTGVVNDLRRSEDSGEAWKDKQILIVDTTATHSGVKGRKGWGLKAVPSEETTADFEANVSSVCLLTKSYVTPRTYSIITRAEVDRLFNNKGGGWATFHEKYPKAAGFWDVSRPGYNARRDEALIYLGHYCGGLCGTGHLLFLTKENGRWFVRNRHMLWIS